jgi:DNA-binding NtrC family response regulator
MKYNVLIVDDEKNIREGLAKLLDLEGYRTFSAADGKEALASLERSDMDLVITDLKMPNLPGEELLRQVQGTPPGLPVIILTGHGTIESAVQAMKQGAYDYLTKPVDMSRLTLLVSRALAEWEVKRQYREAMRELQKRNQFSNIVGKSDAMKRIFEVVQLVSASRASVLITGESGVGKEMIADAIHYDSDRKDKPLIKVHCAALSESLLESELFGHERGAFTGAVARKRGRFELAHRGTIFLDEIGEISPSVQIKLLRVLQDRSFERVGGEETIEADVRVIAATNRDLKEAIGKGQFREDLFYRLNVVNIHIPPLRERTEDIPLLISSFLTEFAQANSKRIEGIDARARTALYNYSWPGNIRELRNCIESAVVMCRSNLVTLEDLPPHIHTSGDRNFVRLGLGLTLAEAEKQIIRAVLLQQNGNKTRAAELLGIGRKTLHRKIQEYGLEES